MHVTNRPAILIASRFFSLSKDLSKELIRKSLHLLIACTPAIASHFGTQSTIALLAAGVLAYAVAEQLRLEGRRIPVISMVTELSMRQRDQNRFVLGPVTLGLGAMLALLFYPEPAATIAIYALAFGDGLSSVAGKVFGTVKIPGTGGKSVEGSLTCFMAVLIAAVAVAPAMPVQSAVLVALAATVLEALPSKDYDNLILPVGTGLAALALM